MVSASGAQGDYAGLARQVGGGDAEFGLCDGFGGAKLAEQPGE